MIKYFTYTCQNHDNNITQLANSGKYPHLIKKWVQFDLDWGGGGGGLCYDHWGTDCNYCFGKKLPNMIQARLGRSTGFFNLFRDLKTREVVQNSWFLLDLVRPGNLNLRKFICCTYQVKRGGDKPECIPRKYYPGAVCQKAD